MKIPKLTLPLKGIRSEEGSATLEFILLAIPLFVPLALFLIEVNDSSSLHFQLQNLSRQIARAYVTSPDLTSAQERVSLVSSTFQGEVFAHRNPPVQPIISIVCSQDPCLTPGSRVQVTVDLQVGQNSQVARATTIETVDQWRSQ